MPKDPTPNSPPADSPPRPAGTPPDVKITSEARKPETDPTLGVHVDFEPNPGSANRLVTIGDSLTQGFQSLAISKTSLSWPALVADALGLGPNEFRYPTYDGYGGLPFNLEECVRRLQAMAERHVHLKDVIAPPWLVHYAHDVKHWWTDEADRDWHPQPGLNHNLAVYSYDIQDSYTRTLADNQAAVASPSGGGYHPLTPHDVDRSARRVLSGADPSMALVDAAKALGDDGGIETLVVALGANNVLDVVINLDYQWSADEAQRQHGHVWSPTLFDADWSELLGRLRTITAEHVILATVPHVTVVPLFAAVGERLRDDSRYFQYYTHYWLRDEFDPAHDPFLSGDQARAVDSAIDQYNETIVQTVRDARSEGRDWYLLEMSGLLDRLAWRRYLSQPQARPSWWDEVGGEFPLPAPVNELVPPASTQFFEAGRRGRTAGGLIALDGVHPTTVGYGLVAQQVVEVMKLAGIKFPRDVDFESLVTRDDTLIVDPPETLSGDLHVVGWLNKHLDWIKALVR